MTTPEFPSGGTRISRRVRFMGGAGFELAGIVDHTSASPSVDKSTPVQPLVVFSHCFTCNKDLKAIVRISRALAMSGVTVLRFDMTGLGGSDGDFSRTNFSTNVADLRAAIQYASQHVGPVTGLIGHSFGGAASLAVAGDPDENERSLRGVATLAAPSDTQHLADLVDILNPSIATTGAGEISIGGRLWTITREMTADVRSHRLGDSISKVRVPLMVLHSPVDETVDFSEATSIVRLASQRPPGIVSPPVSLIALDGSDHLLANHPGDLVYVAELFAAFFKRHC